MNGLTRLRPLRLHICQTAFKYLIKCLFAQWVCWSVACRRCWTHIYTGMNAHTWYERVATVCSVHEHIYVCNIILSWARSTFVSQSQSTNFRFQLPTQTTAHACAHTTQNTQTVGNRNETILFAVSNEINGSVHTPCSESKNQHSQPQQHHLEITLTGFNPTWLEQSPRLDYPKFPIGARLKLKWHSWIENSDNLEFECTSSGTLYSASFAWTGSTEVAIHHSEFSF